ncbi:MAG: alpha/beta fold hydrolase [Phycisphaerae bacterium]|jgi:pimeloyl-ACP methyl ester carboxylesterase|nr:alpha/beta fold hydrolase [Phycisphaerae bacterium]
MKKQLVICLTGLVAAVLCGCENNSAFMTPERLDAGLVVILPGIEGESGANQNVRDGLDSAGVGHSLQIWHWGRPVPGVGMILNQIDFLGNYIAGERIAKRIMEYQDKYPDRPVHIIGHSGGGGIAVFAAAAMPEGREVTGLVLLSASISSNHDITRALQHCSSGIVNFYNKNDLALLGLATTVLGNVGGAHGPSAGLMGFSTPKESASDDKKLAYQKLYQVPLTDSMLEGATAHFATTQPYFVTTYVAPWVDNSSWPADPGVIAKRARQSGAEVIVFNKSDLLRPER